MPAINQSTSGSEFPELLTNRYALFEKFTKRPALNAVLATYTASVAAAEAVATNVANKDFSILGTGAVTADITFYAEGGLNLATHGGATDSAILLPALQTNQSAWSAVTWGTDQQTHWGCTIKTGAALTNTTLWAGLKLTNTPTIATDNDQAMFRFVYGTHTKWTYVYSIGGTDSSATGTEIGDTIAAATEYLLEVIIDSSRIAHFLINGVDLAQSTALTDATDFIPYIGVLSATDASAKTLIVRNEFISRKYA